ncbi:MAG TPA: endopeptidase La, partial [Alphaproteobacteria bacterium]|nr:endopeptidase La [Alphaproteobacteria bacterium]
MTENNNIPQNFYPVLPLRDIVVFPGMIVPLFVGRNRSVEALEYALEKKTKLILVTQRNAAQDDPKPEDLYRTGVLVNILQLLKLPDGTVKVLIEGISRIELNYYIENPSFFEAAVFNIAESPTKPEEVEPLLRSVVLSFENYVKLNKKIPYELISNIQKISNPSLVADTIATHLVLKLPEKQSLLETIDLNKRLEKLIEYTEREIDVLNTERKIRSRVRNQMEKTQKEYYLNEQMKAIKKELGDEEEKNELKDLEEKIKNTKFSKEAEDKAKQEFKKLKMMSPMSAEAGIVRNYLETLVSLPWGITTSVNKNISKAEKSLDEDHYGLEKVKERIVEYLAVLQRSKEMKGTIICLVGPPGVGKTSLAKS